MEPGRRRPPRKPSRILLVEDNPTNQQVAAKLIERLGYAVDVAADGVEAVAACGGKAYDLVFMDIMMPKLDGLAATRAIRKLDPPFSRPRIVAFTANAQEHDVAACLAAGMDDFIAKPVTRSGLTAKLAWLHDRTPRHHARRPPRGTRRSSTPHRSTPPSMRSSPTRSARTMPGRC